MLIHSENNNILLTGNGIYIQIQLGLFTVQGLEGVACCVWAGWNLATDLGKWKKFNHDLWILCQLKCMICSICRPCFKQIYIFMTIKPCVASENQRNSLCGFGPWQISMCPTSEIYVCEKNLTSWIYCFFFLLLLLLLSFFGFVLFCFFFNNSNIKPIFGIVQLFSSLETSSSSFKFWVKLFCTKHCNCQATP